VASVNEVLTREKLGLHIFEPRLRAREAPRLSKYPRGVNFEARALSAPTRL